MDEHSGNSRERIEDLDVPEEEGDEVKGGLQADQLSQKVQKVQPAGFKQGIGVKWEGPDLDA